MEKREISMNKTVYLGLSVLKLGKMLMYDFWYVSKTKIWWKSKIDI